MSHRLTILYIGGEKAVVEDVRWFGVSEGVLRVDAGQSREYVETSAGFPLLHVLSYMVEEV